MRDDGAEGGRARIPSCSTSLPFFIPTLLAPRGTFTRPNNFVVLSVWHRSLLRRRGEEEEEESLLRFVGPWQWLGEPWHLAPEQKSHPVKTFEGHPVAAGLWDTPQVANT